MSKRNIDRSAGTPRIRSISPTAIASSTHGQPRCARQTFRPGWVAQRLEESRPAEAPRAAVDEDAAVEEERNAETARLGEDRLDVGVVRIPAGRHHLRAGETERLDGVAKVRRSLPVARIDDGEADQPVGAATDQPREVLVGASERRSVVEREAFAQERSEQDADIDVRLVERPQHVVGALGAAAVQVRIDDHREPPARTSAGLGSASRVPGLAARILRSAGCAWSCDELKSWGRAALLPDNGAGAGLVVMQRQKPDTTRQSVCRFG
jgi:hypothetical protein